MEDKLELQAGLERLRVEMRLLDEQDAIDGHDLGRAWALKHASYAELQRLGRMDLTQNITPYDVRVAIAGDDADWTDCDPFNDEHPSDQLASSFVDGAIGVLSQVPR